MALLAWQYIAFLAWQYVTILAWQYMTVLARQHIWAWQSIWPFYPDRVFGHFSLI